MKFCESSCFLLNERGGRENRTGQDVTRVAVLKGNNLKQVIQIISQQYDDDNANYQIYDSCSR